MSSLAKANISISKKDLTKSRIPPVASRNVVFYHKATSGQSTINLLALTMPSEMPSQIQATVSEIDGARLFNNRKNLQLVSSSKGELIQGLDYVVTSAYTINLIGSAFTSGAEPEEIFVGTINSAPISDLVVSSAKSIFKTYELAVGQTILNLGKEYKVGENPLEDIGILKVFVNGIIARRGVDYIEVDSGSGYGSTIQFLVAPASLPHQIVVDFGVMAITDQNAIGDIQSLSGAVKKIADDLAEVAGTDADDYFAANPSDVERRTFGDNVLDLLGRIAVLESLSFTPFYCSVYHLGGQSLTVSSDNVIKYTNVIENAPAYNSVTGEITVGEGGLYNIEHATFFDTTAANGTLLVRIYVNGVYHSMLNYDNALQAADGKSVAGSKTIRLPAAAKVQMTAHTNNASWTIYNGDDKFTWVTVTRVGK